LIFLPIDFFHYCNYTVGAALLIEFLSERPFPMRRHLCLSLLCGVCFLLAAAVSGGGETKKDKPVDYYPLQVGNQWNYKLDVNGKDITMITRIAKIETIKEKAYARLEAEVMGKVTATEHLRVTDKGIIRLKTNDFEADPPLLLVKSNVKAGDKWGGAFTVMGKKAKYDAVAEEEMVKVPAGRFKTMRVAIRLEEGAMVVNTTYWFAPGVGFVKQTVTAPMLNITIELEKYKLTKK
jgi:hypothetical protein